MKRAMLFIAVTATLAVTLTTAPLGAAARASNPTHLTGEFVFPATWCGFSGLDDVELIDNFATKPDGSHYDAGQVNETFTADNGRGVKVTFDAGLAEFAAPAS